MSGLPPLWAGLARLAPRLPPGVTSLASLGAEAMLEALPDLAWRARVLRSEALPGTWLRADDPRWPPALHGLPGAPLALAVEGDLTLLEAPGVAVVGTRHTTSTGRAAARTVAAAVVAHGAVVVSGLAAGIDAEAHHAAGGRTIAVIGQGLAASMPAWQAAVRQRIVRRGGLVLSEYPYGWNATRYTFPERNRVVAGLARGVVVVEAGHRSGAKITATHAQRFGRPVAAWPGPAQAPSFFGCADLLAAGAWPADAPGLIVRVLGHANRIVAAG